MTSILALASVLIVAVIVPFPSTSSSGLTGKRINDLLFADVATKNIPEEHLVGPYTIYRKSLTWQDARKYCESKDEYLASFLSSKEAVVVIDKLFELSDPPSPEYIKGQVKSEFGLDRRYWIGLTDLYSGEGNWKWMVGTKKMPLTYTNLWFPGQPDHVDSQGVSRGRQEHCGALWNPTFHKNRHHSFADHDCNSKYYFICEKDEHAPVFTQQGGRSTDSKKHGKIGKHGGKITNSKYKLGRTPVDAILPDYSNPFSSAESNDPETTTVPRILHPLFPNLNALRNHPGFFELFQDSESGEIAQARSQLTTKSDPEISTVATTVKPSTTGTPSTTVTSTVNTATTAATIALIPSEGAKKATREAKASYSDLTKTFDESGFYAPGPTVVKDSEKATNSVTKNSGVSLIEELYAAEIINNSFLTQSDGSFHTNITFNEQDNSSRLVAPDKGVISVKGSITQNTDGIESPVIATSTPKSVIISIIESPGSKDTNTENVDNKLHLYFYNNDRRNGGPSKIKTSTESHKPELSSTLQDTTLGRSGGHRNGSSHDTTGNGMFTTTSHSRISVPNQIKTTQKTTHTRLTENTREGHTDDRNLTETINEAIRTIVSNVNEAIHDITYHITAVIKNATLVQLHSSSSANIKPQFRRDIMSLPDTAVKNPTLNYVGSPSTKTPVAATTTPATLSIKESVELKHEGTTATEKIGFAGRSPSTHIGSKVTESFGTPTAKSSSNATVPYSTTTAVSSFTFISPHSTSKFSLTTSRPETSTNSGNYFTKKEETLNKSSVSEQEVQSTSKRITSPPPTTSHTTVLSTSQPKQSVSTTLSTKRATFVPDITTAAAPVNKGIERLQMQHGIARSVIIPVRNEGRRSNFQKKSLNDTNNALAFDEEGTDTEDMSLISTTPQTQYLQLLDSDSEEEINSDLIEEATSIEAPN